MKNVVRFFPLCSHGQVFLGQASRQCGAAGFGDVLSDVRIVDMHVN